MFRSDSALEKLLFAFGLSPFSAHHCTYAWKSSCPVAWSAASCVHLSCRNRPTGSDSRRYSRVAFSTTGALPSPAFCHSRHPRTAQARMQLSDVVARASRVLLDKKCGERGDCPVSTNQLQQNLKKRGFTIRPAAVKDE